MAETVKHILLIAAVATSMVIPSAGCSLFPDVRERDSVHNPFPQMQRVAVLPFFNQSSEPTVDTEVVAEKYYAALQAVPGFEVLPIGVTKAQWMQYAMTYGEPSSGAEFQRLAQMMGVDAIVVGSVTDFDAYYPPQMAMTVHWYAANEGFHPIPAGYGLPWGTDAEKQIPKRIAREAEFALARSQLATQTPAPPTPSTTEQSVEPVSYDQPVDAFADPFGDAPLEIAHAEGGYIDGSYIDGPHLNGGYIDGGMEAPLPPQWPDPTDFIPDPPSPVRPMAITNHEPVLTHTKIYRGDDPYFTNRLADFVETGDDARSTGWQGYLKRSDDFIHFCCHLHIMEMLESRGGREQSDLILRWPLSRY